MSDFDRVKKWFAEGTLTAPDTTMPDFVDFVRALHTRAGVEGFELSRPAESLLAVIPPAEHIVLVIIDGLGTSMLERCPQDGFLRNHAVGRLRAVFPSTTAVALTSLATAEYPVKHGATGWWVWLPEYRLTTTILPFEERFSEKPLGELGVTLEQVLWAPTIAPTLRYAPLTLIKEDLVNSVYTHYCAGGTEVAGYKEPSDAFEKAAARIETAETPMYVYLYLPQVDGLAHEQGVESEVMRPLLAQLDGLCADLNARIGKRALLVVTGDHGLLDVETGLWLQEEDELMDLLVCPPTSEARLPYFHVRPGQDESFRKTFNELYGTHFALLATDEAAALGLFGPERLTERARRRIGDFIGIAATPTALWYRPREGEAKTLRGVHGGLTSDEIIVPLIVV